MSEQVVLSKPKKLRRNTRACDFCSRRSVRCRPSREAAEKCQNCFEYDETCTFDRPLRKRGAKPKHVRQISDEVIEDTDTLPAPGALEKGSNFSHDAEVVDDQIDIAVGDGQPDWRATIPCTQAQVMDLTEIYFEVIYPVFPFFHRPTLRRRISRGEHMTDRSFFSSVMALCALSSARARDGALYSRTWDLQSLSSPTSEDYFRAAEDSIPHGAALTQDFDYMRATSLLAITSIQYGKSQLMSYHLSVYHSFVAVGGLHDEANWPPDRGVVETEERRRLFWSTYTLDIFTSIIWNGIVRSREASSNVEYPIEVDDQLFSDNTSYASSAMLQSSVGNGTCWLHGWNFVTDLYRILEHSVDPLRQLSMKPVRSWSARASEYGAAVITPTHILHQVSTMYSALPNIFKATEPITCNLETDLFSFQAANVAATMQLVRMVHLSNGQSTLEQKCQVASEVIAGFASVPMAYVRAISSPLLHHLGGIGTILGAAFQDGMTESAYTLIRSVLLDLATLLANLEVDLLCPSGTSEKLRLQVSRIDDYMTTQRIQLGTNNRDRTGNALPQSPRHQSGDISLTMDDSPQYHFPPELFEDWSWAFDLT